MEEDLMRNFPLDFQKMATVRNSLLGIPSLAVHFQRIHPRQFRSRSLSRPVELLIYTLGYFRLRPPSSHRFIPSIARSFRARCRFDAFLFLHAKPVSFAPWQHQHLLQLLQGFLYPVIQSRLPSVATSVCGLASGIALALQSAAPAVLLLVLALTWLIYHQVVTRDESTANLPVAA
jgi:hypothetical protein